jgi:multidrug efflux pump subunit AcrA (membrane-fusion protein)
VHRMVAVNCILFIFLKFRQLKRCTDVMESIRASANQIQQLEWQVQEAERRVLEKRQSLESTLTASDAELKRDIADFDNVMRTRTQELQAQQRAVATLNADITRVRERIDALNLKRGQVELLQEQSRQLREQQAQNGAFLQRKYALPALPVTGAGNAGWGPNVVRTFVTNLGNEVSVKIAAIGVHSLIYTRTTSPP